MALTDKQKRFVDEYLIDFNATQAAIRAGYSEKTSYSIGQENLNKPEIQKFIKEKQAKMQDKTEITQEKIISELAAIGFATATDFAPNGFPIDEKANYKGSSKLKALELIGKYLGLFDENASKKTEDIKDDPLTESLKDLAGEMDGVNND